MRNSIRKATDTEVPEFDGYQEAPLAHKYDDYEDYLAHKRALMAPEMEENRGLRNMAYERHRSKTIQAIESDHSLSVRDKKILLMMLGYFTTIQPQASEVEDTSARLKPDEMNFFEILLSTSTVAEVKKILSDYRTQILWKYKGLDTYYHYIFAEKKKLMPEPVSHVKGVRSDKAA